MTIDASFTNISDNIRYQIILNFACLIPKGCYQCFQLFSCLLREALMVRIKKHRKLYKVLAISALLKMVPRVNMTDSYHITFT